MKSAKKHCSDFMEWEKKCLKASSWRVRNVECVCRTTELYPGQERGSQWKGYQISQVPHEGFTVCRHCRPWLMRLGSDCPSRKIVLGQSRITQGIYHPQSCRHETLAYSAEGSHQGASRPRDQRFYRWWVPGGGKLN